MKKSKMSLIFAVLFMFSMSVATAFAGGQDDSVLSQHVKEADGTSGQNTNSGSGIKTGHLQDGAVTAPKITDGSVTTPKLADDTVTTPKVVDSAVTTPKIADGSVTDAKIMGPISASKISSTGLDADTVDGKHASELAPAVHTHNQSDVNGLTNALDGKADVSHNHDGVYQKKYANVIVVSKDGNGDFSDPVAAMNSITDPSQNNPYLIRIMPGVYDVGYSGITSRLYVDIEGSGRHITKLVNNGGSGYPVIKYFGLPLETVNYSLRDIAIEGQHGISLFGNTDVDVFNVEFNVLGSSSGIEVQENGKLTLTSININGTGILLSDTSYAKLNLVTIDGQASTGIQLYFSGTIEINNSKIDNVGNGLYLGGTNPSSGSAKVYNSIIHGVTRIDSGCTFMGAGTQIDGVTNSGTFKCFNCYDGNFDPLSVQ